MPPIALPAGTHYAAMWGIPDQYAGMTASMLQRSRAFVEYAGVDVTILTFEPRSSYDEVRDRLRERGAMVDGMQLVNLWEDLRQLPDAELSAATFDLPVPADFAFLGDRGEDTNALTRELRDDDGAVIQIDFLRPDGTVLLTEDRNADREHRRRFTLCDTSGQPLGTWVNPVNFRGLWLDRLPRDPTAWIIVDSKTAADALLRYDRPDVVKMHVVRGSHLRNGDAGPMSELAAPRQRVIQRLDAWDAVAFLTQRQLDDVQARFGPLSNLHVIPNSRKVPPTPPRLRRPAGRGVMLATLDARKQIDHAIEAVTEVKRRLRFRRISLDVWGRGNLESKLAKLIKRLRAPVRLRGHSPVAVEEFTTASFSLFTSRSEAFGNVLIESMGRGCIPISYDMPYGPSEIITHGVDGFLVPPGDKAALTNQIQRLVTAPTAELADLRSAGYRRAHDFTNERQVERWQGVMRAAAIRRGL